VLGEVLVFKQASGYGFIKPDGGGPDIFFHIQDAAGRRPFHEGDRVEFEVGSKAGKTRAVGLRLAGQGPAPADGPPDGECEVVTEDEFLAKLEGLFREVTHEIVSWARRNGWVEG
jgi:cold shock CspA family protein